MSNRRRRLALLSILPIATLVIVALFFGGRPTRSSLLDEEEGGGGVDQYTVVYEVADSSGTHRRELSVDRPFIARVVDRAGVERDDPIVREQVSALGHHAERTGEDGEWTVVNRDAVLALGDTRFDGAVDDAVELGLVRRVDRDDVAGHACTRYQTTGDPAGDGTLGRPEDAARSYTEVCLTDEGVLLAMERVVDGAAVERLRAIEVDTDAAFARNDLALPDVEPLTLRDGGGAFEPVDLTAALAVDQAWVLTPPSEWELQGRWATVPATGEAVQDPTQLPLSITDVWLRGADALVLVQGPALLEDDPVISDRVDTPVGEAQVIVGARMTELRIPQPDGQTVRLFGALPVEQLVDLADRIEEVPVTPDSTTTTGSTTSTTAG